MVCNISSAPSLTRMTKPRRSPSGTSTVLAKPMRSIQKGSDFSISSTIKTGVIFMARYYAERRDRVLEKTAIGVWPVN